MEEAWKVVKDHSTPILFRSLKFRDMNKEQKNEALRDAVARVVFLLLLPYLLTMIISFGMAVTSMIFLNELIAKTFGSYESYKLIRRGTVVLSGSTVLGSCLLFSFLHIIPSFYYSIGALLGLQ